MVDFVSVVNDLLVTESIISGDDDAISAFSDTQHVASIRLAKKAVQQELAALISDQLIPFENTSAIMAVSARTAALSTDFVRMQDEIPWLVETNAAGVSSGNFILEYPGGEARLRKADINYRENTGKPSYWYWVGGTAKTLGFYTVPETTYYYRYYYERDVSVSAESDTVPFVTQTEVNVFVQAAARRFKYLKSSPAVREGLFPSGLSADPVILESRATLAQLLRYKPPATSYGRSYR